MDHKTIGEHLKSFAPYSAVSNVLAFNIGILIHEFAPHLSFEALGAMVALIGFTINGLMIIISKKANGHTEESTKI